MIAEKTLAISEENVLMVSIHSHADVIKDLQVTDAKQVRNSITFTNTFYLYSTFKINLKI